MKKHLRVLVRLACLPILILACAEEDRSQILSTERNSASSVNLFMSEDAGQRQLRYKTSYLGQDSQGPAAFGVSLDYLSNSPGNELDLALQSALAMLPININQIYGPNEDGYVITDISLHEKQA